MKNWLTEYFYHTKAERRGAWLLAIIALLLFLLPQAYPLFVEPPPAGYQAYADSVQQYLAAEEAAEPAESKAVLFYFDPNTLPQDSLVLLGLPRKTAQTIVKFRNKVRPFRQPEDLLDIYTLDEADYQRLLPYVRIQASPAGEQAAAATASSTPSRDTETAALLFPFDPNTLSGDSLQLLGIRGRTVRNLLKYREKGGRFYKKDDLRKIYGLRAATYERLAPYVRIPESPAPKVAAVQEASTAASTAPVFTRSAGPAVIDINRAGPEEWQQLRGIGPAYARRICSFRDKLGGFVSVNQVAETYGLPDSTFQQLQPKFRLSPVFRKINVNTADAAGLQDHPYLSWKQANAIVAYRNQHGAFSSVDEVARVRALPADLHRKMRGYWRVE